MNYFSDYELKSLYKICTSTETYHGFRDCPCGIGCVVCATFSGGYPYGCHSRFGSSVPCVWGQRNRGRVSEANGMPPVTIQED